jgi:hypothetical protein
MIESSRTFWSIGHADRGKIFRRARITVDLEDFWICRRPEFRCPAAVLRNRQEAQAPIVPVWFDVRWRRLVKFGKVLQ